VLTISRPEPSNPCLKPLDKREIPVITSTPNRIPWQDEALVLGGGVAGCAAAIALSRKGRSVTLIEREPTPRHKVCGEFLSGEALEDLRALGVDVTALGAVPIDYVRLAASRRAAEAPLPFSAASLTRRTLDTALIAEAIAAGVRVERGRSVQAVIRTTRGMWQATLDDGTVREAPAAFLATGKHDLRGHARPKDPQRWVAFKMYYRLAPAQAAELARASELMLYPGEAMVVSSRLKAALQTSAGSCSSGISHAWAIVGKTSSRRCNRTARTSL
jgi:menaquinone-9 beta-reductase